MRGHRVLHMVGKRGRPLVLRPLSGKPIDSRNCYRMVARIAKAAGILRHISPHSLRHAAITNALDAGVPLRDAQIPGHRLPLQRQRRQHPDRDHRPQLQPHLRGTPLRHPRRRRRPPTSGNSSSRPPPSDWTSPTASSPGADSASRPRTGCPRCRRRSHNSYPRADSEEASTGPPASAGYRWLDGGPGTWVMPRPRTARAVRRKDQVSPIRGAVPCSSVLRRLRGGRTCRVTPPRMTR
jgi:hypothetical protein